MKRDEFLERIAYAWTRESSYDPARWTPDNPAWGQCAVTAMVAKEVLGYDIMYCKAFLPTGEPVHHYFNRTPSGETFDATVQQFPPGTTFEPPKKKPPRKGIKALERRVSMLREELGSTQQRPVRGQRNAELEALYREIHDFALSRDRGETPLALRQAVARAPDSDLMLLGQGLAQSTQRVTGYPYRKPVGLSSAGQRLDDYLKSIGYTIDHTDEKRTYAYSTDLIPWYPGRDPNGKADLRPTADEVALCWQWFERECGVVRPRAIILLGKEAADHYLTRYAHERIDGGLGTVAGRRFKSAVNGLELIAVSAYHPSAVWGSLEQKGQETWREAINALRPYLGSN